LYMHVVGFQHNVPIRSQTFGEGCADLKLLTGAQVPRPKVDCAPFVVQGIGKVRALSAARDRWREARVLFVDAADGRKLRFQPWVQKAELDAFLDVEASGQESQNSAA